MKVHLKKSKETRLALCGVAGSKVHFDRGITERAKGEDDMQICAYLAQSTLTG